MILSKHGCVCVVAASSFSSQIMIIVYGIECGDFYLILSLFVSLCILLGLYGVTKAMIHPFIAYNVLVYRLCALFLLLVVVVVVA